MSEKKAGFIALIIILLFMAAGVLLTLLVREALQYICYGLSVFGLFWLRRQLTHFIQKDDRAEEEADPTWEAETGEDWRA